MLKVGDRLFVFDKRQYDSLIPETYLRMIYVERVVITITENGRSVTYHDKSTTVKESDIGKTAFLTLDEALAKMSAMTAA